MLSLRRINIWSIYLSASLSLKTCSSQILTKLTLLVTKQKEVVTAQIKDPPDNVNPDNLIRVRTSSTSPNDSGFYSMKQKQQSEFLHHHNHHSLCVWLLSDWTLLYFSSHPHLVFGEHLVDPPLSSPCSRDGSSHTEQFPISFVHAGCCSLCCLTFSRVLLGGATGSTGADWHCSFPLSVLLSCRFLFLSTY